MQNEESPLSSSRRAFLSRIRFVPPLVSTLACASSDSETEKAATEGDISLAGMTLKQLRELYKTELENYLEFWDSHGIDHRQGGFLSGLDEKGVLVNSSKGMALQGRGLWIYSYLYNNFGQDPAHLEIARRTKEFLFEHGRDREGNWHDRLNRNGDVLSPFKGSVYAGLYIAEGLQEYSVAARDEQALEESVRTFVQCMRHYDRSDFGITFNSSYPPGTREQATEMVIILVLPQLLERRSLPTLEEFRKRTVEAFQNRFFHPEFRLHNEVLSHSYERYADEQWRDFVHLGFSIATFWRLLREALRQKDLFFFETVSERLKRHLEVAWDPIYGGLGWSTQVEDGVFNFQKVSYVHQEAMLGLLWTIEQGRAEWARDWFGRLHRYTFDNFKVAGHNSWYIYLDRQCSPPGQVERQENYHLPRFLMLSLRTLDRMIRV